MAKCNELVINYFRPLEKNDIKEVSVIIAMWTLSLNYEYYIKELPDVLFELSLNGDSKEDFLKEEIEDIRERIYELRFFFSRYSVNPKVKYISELNSTLGNSDIDPLDLLKDIQNKTKAIDPKERMLLIIKKISDKPLSHILPYCCSAYLDLIRIYQSLESQSNIFRVDTQDPSRTLNGKSLPDNPNAGVKTISSSPKNIISFESCTQAVLYHKILQESDDVDEVSHFKNVKQETKNLVEMYVKLDGGKWTANSFNKAYYKVVKGKYTSSDYDFVTRTIEKRFSTENYPTVWERLKKHTKKSFF